MTSKKKPKKAGTKSKAPRRKKKATPREAAQHAVPDREPARAFARPAPRDVAPPGVVPREKPLIGDLPSVTLRNADEVFHHFSRIDQRLAEAWRRDVVVHEGPITLRRVMSSVRDGYGNAFGGATHYAYVDRRLLWYLTHDPSDPLGARWDGYLASARDAPPGTTAERVGLDVVAKKVLPRLEEGDR